MLASLEQMEPRLRCEDDPLLIARPTPWRSVFACTHGFWTSRNEHLIRVAEEIPELRSLQPRQLFPHDIGVLPCRISVGGPATRTVSGKCGVAITHGWSSPTLTFSEGWPASAGRPAFAHHWLVQVNGGSARLLSQSKNAVPQRLE
jgi:hypothetical protein